MENLLLVLVILLIVGSAAAYVIRAKKQGQKCVGCPYSKECASRGCGCGKNGTA
jgi:uncharacterized protein (UPF0333 family)